MILVYGQAKRCNIRLLREYVQFRQNIWDEYMRFCCECMRFGCEYMRSVVNIHMVCDLVLNICDLVVNICDLL